MILELEKTYLAKYLPKNLLQCKSKEIIDLYIPKHIDHSKLRIRKNWEKLEMTKKIPLNGDVSSQQEFTIPLSQDEFNVLMTLEWKKIHKIRYYYNYNGLTAEFDVFQGDLQWLVLVDFEFESEEQKQNFTIPDFCLLDVTTEDFIAGGVLCGKSLDDIKDELDRFWYKKIFT